MSPIAKQLAQLWQIERPAKFCAQWYVEDWETFLEDCNKRGLDPFAEALRLYEEQGDF